MHVGTSELHFCSPHWIQKYHSPKKLSACAKPPYLILPPCIPSPYSIPAHAYLPPILSHPMHTLPLFYPSSCTPSPYSIPAYTHPPPILFHPIHALPFLFYPTVCMSSPVLYQPTHATPLSYSSSCNSLSHEPGRHVSPLTSGNATFESAHHEYIIVIHLA